MEAVEAGGEVSDAVLQPEPQAYQKMLQLSPSSLWHKQSHVQTAEMCGCMHGTGLGL